MHNPYYENVLKAGDIVVNDSGAESPLHYASDITRTIPIGGRFSQRQREIYSIVLDAQEKALGLAKPGIEWREVHRLAAVALMEGLKGLGLIGATRRKRWRRGRTRCFSPAASAT